MALFVSQNNKGFTIVETLVALVIVMVMLLGLVQAALLSIDNNLRNVLNDEAVRIAEQEMSEVRNTTFDNLIVGASNKTISVSIRNITNFSYTVTKTITSLSADSKRVDISVIWDWKEKTQANGNPYIHSISTIVRR